MYNTFDSNDYVKDSPDSYEKLVDEVVFTEDSQSKKLVNKVDDKQKAAQIKASADQELKDMK